MPHLETVAGDATDRSATSNSILMVTGFSFRRSPLGRHRVQLSSSTYGRTLHALYVRLDGLLSMLAFHEQRKLSWAWIDNQEQGTK